MELINNVDEVKDFLLRYETRRSQAQEDSLERFKHSFNRLRPAYEELQRQVLEEARLRAPNFNIFHLLGVAHLEVPTHSAFLASLFRSDGSHGQQFLFLETFLAYCAGLEDFPGLEDPIAEGDWLVKTERHTVHGNLDIVIASPTLGYLVVIENKVYAGEQDQQLARYAKWLNEQLDEYPTQALIYLTLTGASARTSNDNPYFKLSYRYDIANWLDSVIGEIAAPTVRETVRQYRHLIVNL